MKYLISYIIFCSLLCGTVLYSLYVYQQALQRDTELQIKEAFETGYKWGWVQSKIEIPCDSFYITMGWEESLEESKEIFNKMYILCPN